MVLSFPKFNLHEALKHLFDLQKKSRTKKSKKKKLEKAAEEVANGPGSGSGEDEPIAARTRKRSSPERWEGYRNLNDLTSLILWKVKKRD